MGCRMERGEELDGEEAQLTQFSFCIIRKRREGRNEEESKSLLLE